jgi:putative membrane protein
VLFHLIGWIGIGVLHNAQILQATPIHLLLMAVLLVISARQDRRLLAWMGGVFLLGYVVEWIGIHTGLLFGTYRYGAVLGPQLDAVPLLIGLNWVTVLTGACSVTAMASRPRWQQVLGAALIATAFDWLLEPVAVRLGYWQWADGVIPAFNYLCWFGVSAVMAACWTALRLRPNHFAIALLLIEAVFFALLRL